MPGANSFFNGFHVIVWILFLGSLIETNITSAGQMNYLKVLTNSMVQTKDDDKEYPIMDITMHICSETDEPKRFYLFLSNDCKKLSPARVSCLSYFMV